MAGLSTYPTDQLCGWIGPDGNFRILKPKGKSDDPRSNPRGVVGLAMCKYELLEILYAEGIPSEAKEPPTLALTTAVQIMYERRGQSITDPAHLVYNAYWYRQSRHNIVNRLIKHLKEQGRFYTSLIPSS